MENTDTDKETSPEKESRPGCLRILGIASVVALIIILVVAGWVKYNIYASKLTPTELNAKEQKVLKSKLSLLMESAQKDRSPGSFDNLTSAQKDHAPGSLDSLTSAEALKPEPYSEVGAKREISLTEKELNWMIADEPEVARKVAIDLSEDLVSVKLVIPMDEDILILGGKTLRLNLGLILSYENSKPVVAIKGVSIGGIPMPNAWLGYMKERNLVEEFGTETGFWKLFSEGINNLAVKEGHILISLKE
jgi:hypothetical protein